VTDIARKTYFPGLDLLKFILAVMIIAAHCRLFEELSDVKMLFDRLFSIAVPLFFAMSAFFFIRKIDSLNENDKRRQLNKTIKRLIILFGIWYVLMLPMTWFRWWSIATLKETVYAVFLSCTLNGYWFIKALIINTVILYLCRDRRAMFLLAAVSFAVYLLFAYNFIFHFLPIDFSPYYSFYYHTSYFCVGAIMARYYDRLHTISLSSRLLVGLWVLLFVLVSFLPFDPLYRVFSILLLFPVFERLDMKCVERFKTMRNMSIILYMVQFVLIWLYDGACDRWLESESIQYSVLQFSVVRFLVVLSIAIAIAWVILELEKRPKRGFLKYLH
jgi:peptidoglycan/LPS O-acetylase OafA/YrhL